MMVVRKVWSVLISKMVSPALFRRNPSLLPPVAAVPRFYRFNTNGGIVTGDGMALAYRHGVPLRDMEFVQYHPTGLPGSGILMTEGCRGEGGILLNKDGYRYLQDYGLGPEIPVGETKNKYMELGPLDRLSQAFWQEQQRGRTIESPFGDTYIWICAISARKNYWNVCHSFANCSRAYMGVDPVKEPIPVRPVVHYTMGGIETDGLGATRCRVCLPLVNVRRMVCTVPTV